MICLKGVISGHLAQCWVDRIYIIIDYKKKKQKQKTNKYSMINSFE